MNVAVRHGGLPDLSEGGVPHLEARTGLGRGTRFTCLGESREDLETGLTLVAAAYAFQPLPRDIGMPLEKRGAVGRGVPTTKRNNFLRHARAGRKTTHLLVRVPRTFYTPLQVREPAEMLLSPSGVDSSLYQPSPFHRAQHATCARTLPRYL